MREQKDKMFQKVTLVVFNDYLTDARVSKEANSLSSVSQKVGVCALHFPDRTVENEKIGDISIRRIRRDFPLVQGLIDFLDAFVSREMNHSGSGLWPILRLMIKVPNYFLVYARTFVYLVGSGSDVIHANDINTLPVCYLAAKLTGAKIVYDAHELCTSQEGLRHLKWVLFVLEKFLSRRVDVMFTTTRMRAGEFSRQYGVPAPTVLNNKPRYKKVVQSNLIRERLDLDERPIVLYQGGLQKGRGLHNIIKVASELLQFNFVFIGSGALEKRLKSQVVDLALKNVFFISKVPHEELHNYTCSADLGLQVIQNTCKNHYTTDSNKLFEYLMAGIPVVASDFPEIRKIVEGRPWGRLVDPEDLGSIETSILELLSSFSENEISDTQSYSWEIGEESKLIKSYKEVL